MPTTRVKKKNSKLTIKVDLFMVFGLIVSLLGLFYTFSSIVFENINLLN